MLGQSEIDEFQGVTPPPLDWEIRERILSSIGPACRTYAQLRHALAPLAPADYMPALEQLTVFEGEVVTRERGGLTHHYRRDEQLPPRSNGHSLGPAAIAEANERLRAGQLQPPRAKPQSVAGVEHKTKRQEEQEETEEVMSRLYGRFNQGSALLPRFADLLAAGASLSECARELGISESTLNYWSRKRPEWIEVRRQYGQHIYKRGARHKPPAPATSTDVVVSDARLAPHLAATDALMRNITPGGPAAPSANGNGNGNGLATPAPGGHDVPELAALAAAATRALEGEEIEARFYDFHGVHSNKYAAVRNLTRNVLANVARFKLNGARLTENSGCEKQ
jgi:hypothetical protein